MQSVIASVVVPAHGRANLVARTVHALQRQTFGHDRFEVVVVDDGSVQPLEDALPAAAAGTPAFRIVRHSEPRGAGAARNSGLEMARGDVVIFLDGDCVPAPDLVAEHVKAHMIRDVAITGCVYGRELTPDIWSLVAGTDHRASDWPQAVPTEPLLADPLEAVFGPSPSPMDWPFFWSTNCSVRAEVLATVGGFDDSFEVKGVEDMEFGLRLSRAGVPLSYGSGARALHQPHARDRAAEVARDRHNERRLLEKFPELDVEAVCAFDMTNARSAVPRLEEWLAEVDLDRFCQDGELPDYLAHADASSTLLVGPRAPAASLRAQTHVSPLGGRTQWLVGADRLTLLGLMLPFTNSAFALGVVGDHWVDFPARTFARLLAELCRCCTDVVVAVPKPVRPRDVRLAPILEQYDRPYWENRVPLHRELHDFCFELVSQINHDRGRTDYVRVRPKPIAPTS